MAQYKFHVVRDPQRLGDVFKIRHSVFVEEKGWLAEVVSGYEFDQYDIFSRQLVAIDDSDEVVGCLRLVYDSVIGFPYEKVNPLPEHIVRSKVFEVSRLAVSLRDRGQRSIALLGLTRLVCRIGIATGMSHWCAVVDVPVGRLLKMIGFQFEIELEPVFYLGSMSVPLVCSMQVTQDVLTTPELDCKLADQIEEAYEEFEFVQYVPGGP